MMRSSERVSLWLVCLWVCCFCFGLSAAQQKPSPSLPASVTLSNSKGFKVVLSPIGATIQNIFIPDCKTQKPVDVALGCVHSWQAKLWMTKAIAQPSRRV